MSQSLTLLMMCTFFFFQIFSNFLSNLCIGRDVFLIQKSTTCLQCRHFSDYSPPKALWEHIRTTEAITLYTLAKNNISSYIIVKLGKREDIRHVKNRYLVQHCSRPLHLVRIFASFKKITFPLMKWEYNTIINNSVLNYLIIITCVNVKSCLFLLRPVICM